MRSFCSKPAWHRDCLITFDLYANFQMSLPWPTHHRTRCWNCGKALGYYSRARKLTPQHSSSEITQPRCFPKNTMKFWHSRALETIRRQYIAGFCPGYLTPSWMANVKGGGPLHGHARTCRSACYTKSWWTATVIQKSSRFNQANEPGATVCLPQNPLYHSCPSEDPKSGKRGRTSKHIW